MGFVQCMPTIFKVSLKCFFRDTVGVESSYVLKSSIALESKALSSSDDENVVADVGANLGIVAGPLLDDWGANKVVSDVGHHDCSSWESSSES